MEVKFRVNDHVENQTNWTAPFFSTDSSFLKNSPDGKNLWKGSEDLRFIFQKEEGNNTEKLTY